jgi:site-specific DNA recombinase
VTATLPRRARRPNLDDAPSAALYCRISSDPRDTGLGIDRQREECAALATARGLRVVATHVDNDVSAYSGKRRPGYLALLEAIEAGRVDVVVAWHPDRLHRSPLELEGFIAAVEKADVAVHTVTAGQWDLSTATGRFFARQLGGVARYESEHRGERLKAKLAQNAHRGVTHGRPTYGWRGGYDENRNRRDVLDPTEAEVVRGIARDILAGKSIRSITKDLNECGVASPRGGEWQKGMVRHLVLRPRNAGVRVHQGQEIGEGTWEPLLDRGTFEQVRAVLADPARRTSVGTAAAHLLSGIARCGVCAATMRFAMNRTVPSYRCSGRSCVSRRAENVDSLVIEVVLGRLARPDAADLLAPSRRPERAQAAEEARSLRARLDNAADDYADGKIDARQLERITARLRPRLTDAEARARTVDDYPLLDGLVGQERAREVWGTRTLAQQRAIVDALVTVTVLPTRQGAREFDPRSVDILWRRGQEHGAST